MKIVFYHYDDACDHSISNLPEIEEIIAEMTSECNDPMKVFVLGGNYGEKGERVPFELRSKIYLGVCGEKCALVFELDCLNIRQQIYMMDCGVVPFKDTPFCTKSSVL